MMVVNIHEAKTNLSHLVEEAANGEPFVIAKAGKLKVQVSARDAPKKAKPKEASWVYGGITEDSRQLQSSA